MKCLTEAYTLLLLNGQLRHGTDPFYLEYSLREWCIKNNGGNNEKHDEQNVFIVKYKITDSFLPATKVSEFTGVLKDKNRSDAIMSVQKGIIALFPKTGKIDSDIFIKSSPDY